MQRDLDERDWKKLIRRIKDGTCTPFLGAGASVDVLPLGGQIAKVWAKEHEYPFDDKGNLPRVAQYLAVKDDDFVFLKEDILEQWFDESKKPDFNRPNQPHGVLARLPLPIYITTNYDNFMTQALRSVGKNPREELCNWNEYLRARTRNSQQPSNQPPPSVEEPIVFHLHGHKDHPKSLVLTEDDYLDFLVNISRDDELLPAHIQEAMTFTTLLFIGYSLQDWNFRVLFRGLVGSKEAALRQMSVAVQLDETETPASQAYMDAYFDNMDVRVYWGKADDFMAQLSKHWGAFNNG